jgi:hypothetical protein
MSDEKRDTEVLLERPDLETQGRLRNVKLLGCTSDVADFDDLGKIAQLTKVDGARSRFSPRYRVER